MSKIIYKVGKQESYSISCNSSFIVSDNSSGVSCEIHKMRKLSHKFENDIINKSNKFLYFQIFQLTILCNTSIFYDFRKQSTLLCLRMFINIFQIYRKVTMFQNSLRQILITLSQYEQKLETYRQLLNEQIQFNIKDLYILISGNNSQISAYHLHVFITEDESLSIDIGLLESVIKSYNDCTSMNLSFIQFALIFLSKQNRLLAKLTIERNSLGEIPLYLISYARKILLIESQLHKALVQFRKNNSSAAEQWIKQNSRKNQQTGEELFNQQKIVEICEGLSIEHEIVCRYLKYNQKQPIKSKKMLSLFTLKNCQKLSQFLKRVQVCKTQSNLKTMADPFIRPQFHDCLQRPKILQNFSFREIKSIQKHLQRLNSKSKNQLYQKINHYRSFIQKQLKKVCQAMNDIIQLQKQIESQRIQLCLCTDFYPVLFFDSLNKDRQTLLIPSSLQNYLQKLGLRTQINHIFTIFKRYSSRTDGKLCFNQFCQIFDPCTTKYNQIQRNRMIRTLEDIDIETIKTFLRVIRILIKNELKVEKIKAKLNSQVDLRQVFSFFDGDQDGYISMLDFKIIWKKHLLMQLKQQNLYLLWHRMKLPKDPSSMIKYQKFITEMLAKSSWVDKNAKKKPKSNLICTR